MEHGGGTYLDERMEQHSGAPYVGIEPGIWISWNRRVDQWAMEGAWNDPSESLLECRIQWLCEGRSMGD